MILSRAVYLLRLHLDDVQKIGWPEDDELIEYMDRATSLLTDQLITMRFNSLMKWIDLDGPTELPDDFVTFVGKVPVRIVGKQAQYMGKKDILKPHMRWRDPNTPDDDNRPQWGGEAIDDTAYDPETGEFIPWDDLTKTSKTTLLYWSRLPFPSGFGPDDELPYTEDERTLILELARMFALNKNEYDLTQDQQMFGQITSLMAKARGIVDEND
jgi:hypothetical protein